MTTKDCQLDRLGRGLQPMRKRLLPAIAVLIVATVQPNGGVQTIVWDFSTPREVHRKAFNVGVATEWIARGVPSEFSNDLVLDAVGIPGRPWGVRLTAKDERGRIAIDQILQPRAH